MERPPLTPTLPIADFQAYYWLKEELVDFCRQHSLPSAGSKIELAGTISHFLQTGEKLQPPPKPKKSAPSSPLTPLELTAPIRQNYRSDEEHRAFFKRVIGNHFKFTSGFMQFCKDHAGEKTYADAVEWWQAEHERKKDPNYAPEIAPQFEYNRFMRAFFADNPDKSRAEAIAAWKIARSQAGSHAYQPEGEK